MQSPPDSFCGPSLEKWRLYPLQTQAACQVRGGERTLPILPGTGRGTSEAGGGAQAVCPVGEAARCGRVARKRRSFGLALRKPPVPLHHPSGGPPPPLGEDRLCPLPPETCRSVAMFAKDIMAKKCPPETRRFPADRLSSPGKLGGRGVGLRVPGRKGRQAANWFIVLSLPAAFRAASPTKYSLWSSPMSLPDMFWCFTQAMPSRISLRWTPLT